MGTSFWAPLALGIVEVPTQFELTTALVVAAVDTQVGVFSIEKAGSAAVVAEVVVGKRTSHSTDQSGAKVAAWAVTDAPIRTAHLVENLDPCRHGSIPAAVLADH